MEMTASDMLRDPLIRQLLRADRISLASFAALLEDAARRNAVAFEARSARRKHCASAILPLN